MLHCSLQYLLPGRFLEIIGNVQLVPLPNEALHSITERSTNWGTLFFVFSSYCCFCTLFQRRSMSGFIIISGGLFFALPSEFKFSLTGLSFPLPAAVNRVGSTLYASL